ncbi:MAG: HEAT repeat domain-containing protein [Bryobacteraceae bacterium]|jgi:HEAT repeat protein
MTKPLVWLLTLSAAPGLAAITDQQCTDLLQHALTANNPETRKMAVVALSLAATRGPLFTQLQQMLQDKDLDVRLAVVEGLADMKTTAATTALHGALDDPTPEVVFAAAKALWALNDPAGKRVLLAVLEGENKTASGFITKEKRQALRMMHTPRTTILYAVRQGVGFAPVPGLGMGISSMQQILTDPSVSGRATAALLLGKDKDKATVDALEDALVDKDFRVRAAAVHSLALRNDPALREDLEPLIQDQKEEVRLRAAAALLRLSAIPKPKPGKPAVKR